MQVVHGRRADPSVLTVDPADLQLDLVSQGLVRLDPLPAGSRHLDEDSLVRVHLAVGQSSPRP